MYKYIYKYLILLLHKKSEILSNGSLKLSFKSIKNEIIINSSKFDLIASFKCIANNSNGKITSRMGNVYRFSYLG